MLTNYLFYEIRVDQEMRQLVYSLTCQLVNLISITVRQC